MPIPKIKEHKARLCMALKPVSTRDCGKGLEIMDEPTAALDPLAENDIYLKYASFSQGKTSVFVSHRLSSTRFCDRIILLESGEIREQGTHWELMELGGIYANMFQIQSHYYVNGQ